VIFHKILTPFTQSDAGESDKVDRSFKGNLKHERDKTITVVLRTNQTNLVSCSKCTLLFLLHKKLKLDEILKTLQGVKVSSNFKLNPSEKRGVND